MLRVHQLPSFRAIRLKKKIGHKSKENENYKYKRYLTFWCIHVQHHYWEWKWHHNSFNNFGIKRWNSEQHCASNFSCYKKNALPSNWLFNNIKVDILLVKLWPPSNIWLPNYPSQSKNKLCIAFKVSKTIKRKQSQTGQ